MEEFNQINKEIWDSKLAKQPPRLDDEDFCVSCCDENGECVPAVPLGYDEESKQWSAVREIIDQAVKNRRYKTYRLGSDFVETYDDKHEKILPYDVIYCFSEAWAQPLRPVVVKEVGEDELTLMFIGGRDGDELMTEKIKRNEKR